MGADIFIIDDPHNEQDILSGNTDVFDTAWEWYMSGPRQRLQPGGGIIVVHTRWSKDLIGRLLDYAAKKSRRRPVGVHRVSSDYERGDGLRVVTMA